MKKSIKLLVVTAVLTVAFATPVMATESTLSAESAMLTNKMNAFGNDVSTLVSFDNNCGQGDINSMHAIVDTVKSDVVKSNISEQQNYMNYLQAALGNALETERVKKQNVASLTDLVKVNTSFQAQLDAAVADYVKAVADRQAAEQAIADAKAYFLALNSQFDAASLAKAAKDAQAIIK